MKYLPAFLRRGVSRAAHAGLVVAGAYAGQALAADTPIANAPLFTSSAELIQPNLMFILDNSGSMDWSYLPDAAASLVTSRTERYAARAAQCNGVAYDPKLTYTPPVLSPGVSRPNAQIDFGNPNTTKTQRSLSGTVTLSAVDAKPVVKVVKGWNNNVSYEVDSVVTVFQDALNYYVGKVVKWKSSDSELTIEVDQVVGTVGKTLTNPIVGKGAPTIPYYFVYKGQQPKLGYTYASNGSVITTSDFYKECASAVGSAPGSGVFTRVDVTPTAVEAQNYANWAEYYQTRMEMMKASVSLAVRDLGSRYRIGYSTINDPDDADNFLDIKSFSFDAAANTGHKKDFYARLWAAEPNGSTPLRLALSRAGRYYAKKLSGQSYDPIQYSCQRNYAMLSTDGYWNDGTNPTGLDGNPIGDRDGGLVPPMRDDRAASSTLADVAAYYYHTDLRDKSLWNNCLNGDNRDVCENNVPGREANAFHSFGDNNAQQHMTTFTLGLGVNGTLRYDPDYLRSTTGDFAAIVRGEKSWPKPTSGSPETTDDLWHAAVNGRGRYFSASDPNTLTRSLEDAFNTMAGTTGSASAASTSSLQPVAGDNDIFVAQFTTLEWTGDLLAFKINPSDGSISGTKTWSAKDKLDKLALGDRRILYKQKNQKVLRDFSYANLKEDGYNTHFDDFCSKKVDGELVPRQCADLKTEQLPIANAGANLVKYLAGEQAEFQGIYRERASRLGDIINASPLFVGKPAFKYDDAGYGSFVSAQATRKAVVLAAANDGMLHAFERDTGRELWAYVPTFVMDRMFRLADAGYPNRHVFLVDGSPQMGDVKINGEWRTIVVGGLNAGGRGYYALDVTDTTNPKVLWEFENKNLGLSFGNPIITKRKDGTWVVVFASGYNNNAGGDGNGHLFVLNAATGEILLDQATNVATGTPAGTGTTPSGLARINAWVPSERDNQALRFYGGDLLGNLWRFDIDDVVVPSGAEATLLARLKDTAGNAQPITTRPALGEVEYNGQKHPVVYVATGRYLGLPDLSDNSRQTVYAIKDTLQEELLPLDVRGALLVEQSVTAGRSSNGQNNRTGADKPLPVDWSTKRGWRVDFPVGGERVSVNPQLALETLFVGSNVPSSDPCDVGGESFLYEFNFATGAFRATFVGDVLVQGLTLVQLTEPSASTGSIVTIITRSDGDLQSIVGAPSNSMSTLRRTSWRELVD